MSKKYLYYFSEGNDAFGGDKVTMKNTLGGKGAGLAEMTAAGMPVPQGFTITTDACTQYYADGRQINDDITADIFEHLKGLEEITGKKFVQRRFAVVQLFLGLPAFSKAGNKFTAHFINPVTSLRIRTYRHHITHSNSHNHSPSA